MTKMKLLAAVAVLGMAFGVGCAGKKAEEAAPAAEPAATAEAPAEEAPAEEAPAEEAPAEEAPADEAAPEG